MIIMMMPMIMPMIMLIVMMTNNIIDANNVDFDGSLLTLMKTAPRDQNVCHNKFTCFHKIIRELYI